jgi:glycosyltransferase involved in cell wall biosynthesis
MKVCIVSTHYPSEDAIGEYSGLMAEELSKTAEVIVLANMNPKQPMISRIQSNGGNNQYIVLRIWKTGLFYPLTIFKNLIRQKPDIVHIQHEYFLYGKGYTAVLFPTILILSRIARIRLVVTMHHVIPRGEVRYFKRLLRTPAPETLIKAFLTAFNRTFAFSPKIIVPSVILKKTLSADYKISDEIIEVVNHFTNANVQRLLSKKGIEAKALLGLNERKIILFYGFLRPAKGIEYVLFALQKVKKIIPNVLFLLDFKVQPAYKSYLSYLKQLVHDLELSNYVKFQYISEDLLPAVFAATDAVVFPYISSIGMTPIAHLKAAAYGKPIIATSIESFVNEFVDHENALLVPPKNADALSRSIIEILTDKVLSEKLSNNLTQYCEERSKEKAVSNIIEIYQETLQK